MVGRIVGGRWAAVVVAVALIGGCGVSGEREGSRTPGSSTSADRSASDGGKTGGGLLVAHGHGWTLAGLDGPMPAPGTCHIRNGPGGEPLPDQNCTPGVVDRAVTDGNIDTTVCRKGGYTDSVRPPSRLTDRAKQQLMAAYGLSVGDEGKYELDHLVELNAGGASDVRNLWPEPNTLLRFAGTAFIHNDKDAVEQYTFHAICQGKVTVSAVQRAIAADWTSAVRTLGLPPIPDSYRE